MKIPGVVLVLTVILAGCAPPLSVRTTTCQPPLPGGYHTYAWLDDGTDSEGVYAPLLRNEVSRALAERGLAQVSSDSMPDLYVGFVAFAAEYLSERYAPERYYRGPIIDLCADSLPGPETRKEGTVMVYLLDGKSRRAIWEGVADGERSGSASANRRWLVRALQRLVRDLPPLAAPDQQRGAR